MDRNYVEQKKKTPIAMLGLELWRDNVIRNKQISQRLLALLMDLVSRERSGELIDRSLIKGITTVRFAKLHCRQAGVAVACVRESQVGGRSGRGHLC